MLGHLQKGVGWIVLAPLVASLALAGGVSPPVSQSLQPPPPVSNPDDCSALLEFTSAITNWDEFKKANGLQGWSEKNASCCNWEFVNCSSSGSVSILSLDGNSLPLAPIGSLSASLAELGSLQILSIQNCNLTGKLPSFSKEGSFNTLQQLILSGNALTGSLPASWGRGSVFQSLQTMDLHDNVLSGQLPSSWSQPAFGALKQLNLGMNRLSGTLPDNWSLGFPSLATMSLTNNELNGSLPLAWTSGFWALQELDLSHNYFSGSLPDVWGNSTAFSSLWALRVSGNSFTGTCPDAWSAWSYLGELDLSGNKLTGSLPQTWGTKSMSLYSLSLAHNFLTGSLPSTWSASDTWGMLQTLDVSSNQLTGPLPSSWASPQLFQRLGGANLANNAFQGSLPDNWGAMQGALPKLTSLSLAGNNLTGSLPEAWKGVGMPALSSLDLSKNAFQGTLPTSWGSIDSFDYLRQLFLNDNQLIGSLLPQYGQRGSFPLLRTLQLANNGLNGSVPESWGGLLASVWLKPGNADLCGPLPPQMLSCEVMDSCQPSIGTTCICSLPHSPSPACAGAASAPAAPEANFPTNVAVTLQMSPLETQIFSEALQEKFSASVLSVLPEQSSLLLLSIQDVLLPANGTSRRRSLLAAPRRRLQQVQSPGLSRAPVQAPALSPTASKEFARGLNISVKAVNVSFTITSPNSTMSLEASRDILNSTESGRLLQLFQKAGFKSVKTVVLLSTQALVAPSPPLQSTSPVGTTTAVAAASSPYPAINQPGPKVTSGMIAAIVVVPTAVAILVTCLCCLIYQRSKRRKLSGKSSMDSGSTSGDLSLKQKNPWLTAITKEPPLLSFTSHGLVTRVSGSEVEPTWSDWEARPEEFDIVRRQDGSYWELGRGNFGVVYKGLRNGVTPVAIKVMSRGGASLAGLDPEQKARQLEEFKREILVLKACRDKNIVTFLGASLQDGATMLVTEFCEGGDLYVALQADDKAHSRRFSWYRTNALGERTVNGLSKRIALDIARGLAFLHSRGVVHMDLKSANILLAAGTAKLADVGLCKVLRKEVISTMSGCRGTFSHAAPEVLLGRQCNELLDIWSFGVILWELSTRESPTNRMMRPIRVPEECPEEIARLIERCLSEEPTARPSAVECVQYIDKVR